MRIIFVMAPEWGGYLPAFPLARALQDRHHTVCFGGLHPAEVGDAAGLAAYVKDSGFGYVSLPRMEPPSADGLISGLRAVNDAVRWLIRSGEVLLRRHNFDIALVDPILSFLGLAAVNCDIPVVGLRTNLVSAINKTIPPVTCGYSPRGKSSDSVAVAAHWLSRRIYLRLGMYIANPGRAAQALFGPERWLRRSAHDLGIECRTTEYGLELNFARELYLCPEEFDFPGSQKLFAGGHVEIDRPDPPLDCPPGFGDRPIVYCSLGTHTGLFRRTALRFFRQVVKAFASQREYNLVLHTGLAFRPDEIAATDSLPGNVSIRNWVPQMEMLSRASLMITHGGLGAIKECIYHRVPMLVVPVTFDQPGNAARVALHGLGIRRRIRSITASSLLHDVNQMFLDRDRYMQALQQMRQHALDPRPLQSAVSAIEHHAQAAIGVAGRF